LNIANKLIWCNTRSRCWRRGKTKSEVVCCTKTRKKMKLFY